MSFRYHCPFSLPAPLVADLQTAGGVSWNPTMPPGPEPSPLLLLYPPPHGALQERSALLAGYRQLLELAAAGQLCHLERLQRLPPEAWPALAGGALPALPSANAPALAAPEPLRALVTQAWLREEPAVLDAYLDLELSADLGGSAPDSDYLERLRLATPSDLLLAALEDNRLARELADSRQERESLQQELHRLYEELEHLVQSEHEHQRQQEQRQQELVRLQGQCDELAAALELQRQEQRQEATRLAEAHRRERDALQHERDALQRDLDAQRAQTSEHLREAESLRQQATHLHQQIEQQSQEAAGQAQALQRERDALQRDLDAQRAQTSEHLREAESLRQQATHLHQQIEQQ
ncbi:MAG: hypothetical protein ACK55X_14810, partial [Synechococcaceae cyanobacterium]